jgi:S1-C subfamily serine protease
MKTASAGAQSSVVTVIGIKSEVDYFNNAYDNSGQLSGVVIANNSRELLILTEYGIVEGRDRIQVTFHNGKTVDAQYQKHDPNTRLVILKVPLENVDQDTLESLQMAPLGSSYALSQGEPLIALGSPMGYGDSVAFGAITSITNTISGFDTEYSLVSTDILGSQGGSGILVNLEGEIVGIIAQAFSMEGHTITALSISEIKELIQTLSNNGTIPYVGIKGKDVTEVISRDAGIPQGVYIENMQGDSPAVQAGMMNGDVIVGFGDEKVTTVGDYQAQVETCQAGQVVKIAVMRKGAQGYEEIIFDVTVQAL